MSSAVVEHVWDEVVGQQDAVRQLRAAAASPVHAYLLVGPDGSGKRAAARAFAGLLLAQGLDAAGQERSVRLAAAEAHPDLMIVEREGASIDVEAARSVVRRANSSPVESDRQVIVLVDFHLVRDAAPILLKSIEEPAGATHFVVLAEEIVPELVTIASRCVVIDFSAVPRAAIAERLVAEGFDEVTATTAAEGAGGSLSRARLLARDPEAGTRRELWYRAPERLDGTGSMVGVLSDELLGSIEALLEPLSMQQAAERDELEEQLASLGGRKGDLSRLESKHKREQRRVRVDELRAGLAVLVGRYRDAIAQGGSTEDFATVADGVQRLCENLDHNPRESLALQALLFSLPRLAD